MTQQNVFDVLFVYSIAFIGPSVTTYQTHNPGYRIYEVDGDYPSSSRVRKDKIIQYVCVSSPMT